MPRRLQEGTDQSAGESVSASEGLPMIEIE